MKFVFRSGISNGTEIKLHVNCTVVISFFRLLLTLVERASRFRLRETPEGEIGERWKLQHVAKGVHLGSMKQEWGKLEKNR